MQPALEVARQKNNHVVQLIAGAIANMRRDHNRLKYFKFHHLERIAAAQDAAAVAYEEYANAVHKPGNPVKERITALEDAAAGVANAGDSAAASSSYGTQGAVSATGLGRAQVEKELNTALKSASVAGRELDATQQSLYLFEQERDAAQQALTQCENERDTAQRTLRQCRTQAQEAQRTLEEERDVAQQALRHCENERDAAQRALNRHRTQAQEAQWTWDEERDAAQLNLHQLQVQALEVQRTLEEELDAAQQDLRQLQAQALETQRILEERNAVQDRRQLQVQALEAQRTMEKQRDEVQRAVKDRDAQARATNECLGEAIRLIQYERFRAERAEEYAERERELPLSILRHRPSWVEGLWKRTRNIFNAAVEALFIPLRRMFSVLSFTWQRRQNEVPHCPVSQCRTT